MKAYELTSWLEKKYPSDAAEDWDNVGLLAGDDTNEISHVFLALDLQRIHSVRLWRPEQI